MKVRTEVVAVARDAKQSWSGKELITIELAALEERDDRYFKVQVPQHLERSFPTGRKVILEVRPV